ncbi:histidine kinase [Sulfodiicoccus acidiphilus]|uniref:Histidine kinase n=2 Tax=Sulfodiicoccus acidiphilus TaxID=1670455 RepID=A0A348B284_9CREN|nr:histidine kinase [Sulfodiicoccus acidiphilus]GGT90533.1 histidine kinase [Sulfodiicoccus acidiphilus]
MSESSILILVRRVSFMKIATLMIPDPPLSRPEELVGQALRKVRDRGIGRVIVADEVVRGVVSTRDLISFFITQCYSGCREAEVSSLASTKISNVMNRDPITVSPDDELMDALTIMVARNFGSLPVADKERRPRGLVTERELLLAYKELPSTGPVWKFMSRRVNVVSDDEPLMDAAGRMVRRGFRRLPVLSNGKVIGMLTAADVLRSLAESVINNSPKNILTARVRDVMNRRVITVDPDIDLRDAASILVQKKIGSLLVVSSGELQGIITERDMLLALHYQMHLRTTGEKE